MPLQLGHNDYASRAWTADTAPLNTRVYDRIVSPRERHHVRRLDQEYANAVPLIAAVFGDECILPALRRRVQAVHSAGASTLRANAAQLLSFLRWMASLCEACELENRAAADLRVSLAVVTSRAAYLVNSKEPEAAALRLPSARRRDDIDE